jgi:hypothetical protein
MRSRLVPLLLLPASLFEIGCSQRKAALETAPGPIDISGYWMDSQTPGANTYHITQNGNNLTSDDSIYGHAVGHFTSLSAHTGNIVLTWKSATWTALVSTDLMDWSNNKGWWREGAVRTASGFVDANAGQANGFTDPDCYPAGGAQCGIIWVNIPPAGPSGSIQILSYYAGYSGPLGSGSCNGYAGGAWLCDHDCKFEGLMFFNQPDKTTTAKIRFKNWASLYQRGTFSVQYWAWSGR